MFSERNWIYSHHFFFFFFLEISVSSTLAHWRTRLRDLYKCAGRSIWHVVDKQCIFKFASHRKSPSGRPCHCQLYWLVWAKCCCHSREPKDFRVYLNKGLHLSNTKWLSYRPSQNSPSFTDPTIKRKRGSGTTLWLLKCLNNGGTIPWTYFCQPKQISKPSLTLIGQEYNLSTRVRDAKTCTAMPGTVGRGCIILNQTETAKLWLQRVYNMPSYKETKAEPCAWLRISLMGENTVFEASL